MKNRGGRGGACISHRVFRRVKGDAAGLDLRSELLKASECRFSCEITADYSDKVYTFSMDCQCDSQGNLTFAVTAPETITGITGKVSDAGEADL